MGLFIQMGRYEGSAAAKDLKKNVPHRPMADDHLCLFVGLPLQAFIYFFGIGEQLGMQGFAVLPVD